MDSRRKIILSICLTLAFLLVGTVGYGEIHVLSDAGRVFTMFLLLFGVGRAELAPQGQKNGK